MIARTAEPVSFGEAIQLIRNLRREQRTFPALLEKSSQLIVLATMKGSGDYWQMPNTG